MFDGIPERWRQEREPADDSRSSPIVIALYLVILAGASALCFYAARIFAQHY